jgi:hypothetical protein
LRREVLAVFDPDGSRPGLPALDLAEFSRSKHGAADATGRLGRRLAAEVPAGVTTAERLVVTASCFSERLIEGDYSTMSLVERRAFIAGDVIRVDPEPLAGAAVLVVDGLRVTGLCKLILGA